MSSDSADYGMPTRSVVLTVHLTMDDRYEEACIADKVLAALASADLDDVLVDAVVGGEHAAWGRHLTETVACPYCTTTDAHPLSNGLGCTNGWHHKGDRLRRARRRGEVLGSDGSA